MAQQNQLKIDKGSIVCQETEIVGEVTIGAGTVVHPKASIIAEGGPIIIGANNIIEEHVTIKNPKSANYVTLTIGTNNMFEVASHISCNVGDNNLFETRCTAAKGVTIPNGCTIGAGVTLQDQQVLNDNTIIFGVTNKTHQVKNAQETHIALHSRQLDVLWKTLKNFHHLRPV